MQGEYLGVQALEEHLYIRFPSDLAESVREDLRAVRKPSDISIIFTSPRTATVNIGADEHLPAILVDLPTVTETLKSLDPGSGPSTTGQYCKVADAAQMLIVVAGEEEAMALEKQLRTVDYRWHDGITPPMYQTRQRRFKPESGRRRQAEIECIEDQVRQLLERDEASAKSTFEYHINGKLVRSSGGAALSNLMSTEDNLEEAELAAEIEDELLLALDDSDVEMEEAEGETSKAIHVRMERLKELEAKRSQLERVTNPAIRAFLEETIKQLEMELQQ